VELWNFDQNWLLLCYDGTQTIHVIKWERVEKYGIWFYKWKVTVMNPGMQENHSKQPATLPTVIKHLGWGFVVDHVHFECASK
jgi:hypothetical protein